MCFRFTKTSGRGDAPGPPNNIFRAPRGGRPAWSVPRKPQGERRSRMIGVRAGPDWRTGLPDLLRSSAAAGPPRLRGGRSPSLRPGRLDGIRSAPFRPGRGFDPGRRNGRCPCRRPGDRRRSGGNADHVARRSLRGLSRESRRASTGGDRPPSGDHPATGRPGGPSDPNRERCRSGVCAGGQRGRGPPPASAGDSRSVAPRSKLA